MQNGACARQEKPVTCSAGYEWDSTERRCVVSEYKICGISSLAIDSLSLSIQGNKVSKYTSVGNEPDSYCIIISRNEMGNANFVPVQAIIEAFSPSVSGWGMIKRPASCNAILVNDQTREYSTSCWIEGYWG